MPIRMPKLLHRKERANLGQIEKGSRRVEHVRCPPETLRRDIDVHDLQPYAKSSSTPSLAPPAELKPASATLISRRSRTGSPDFTALRGELNRVLRACAKGRIVECKAIDTLTQHAERSLL